MHSKASKRKEKSKKVWIPKSLLKDLHTKQKSKLTFKLPKASTSHSPKHIPSHPSIFSPCVPRSVSSLTSKSQALSPIFPLLFHYPSRCVSMLILIILLILLFIILPFPFLHPHMERLIILSFIILPFPLSNPLHKSLATLYLILHITFLPTYQHL